MWAFGCNEITIRRNRQHGLRWGVGLDLIGGSGHLIVDNDVSDDLCGIRLTGGTEHGDRAIASGRGGGASTCAAAPTVRAANEVERTMRAHCVEAGSGNTVAGNVARRCDSSVLVELGARDTVLEANQADDCRLDTLVWEST